MLMKRGLITGLLIIAAFFSLFSLSMTFFPNWDVFGAKGETLSIPTNNVELTILPPENVSTVLTLNEREER